MRLPDGEASGAFARHSPIVLTVHNCSINLYTASTTLGILYALHHPYQVSIQIRRVDILLSAVDSSYSLSVRLCMAAHLR